MAKKVSLLNRKIVKKDSSMSSIGEEKKDILRAMQLQELSEQASKTGNLLELPLSIVEPDANQPRKTFKNIESLAASINENGVIQPIIVSPKNAQGKHSIIAGERRFLASKKAGLTTITCVVRTAESDASVLLLQLLENDQRESVSPFEEADALKKLVEQKGVKKSDIAKALGRDASWVSMRLKIADAKANVRELADKGVIEDVRTLYELKKFAEDVPQGADEFISKALDNKITGSYRTAISKYRDAWSRKQKVQEDTNFGAIKIKEISKEGNLLKIKGAKENSRMNVYTFEITEDFKQLLFEALIK